MQRKRRVTKRFWKFLNPLVRPLSGIAPWWVLLETTGRRSGRLRRTPLARGCESDGTHWVIAVHGEASDFVRNLTAHPRVRIRTRGRWHTGRACVEPVSEDRLARFSAYARSGMRTVGIEPCFVRIELDR